jgi:hypothetical protein
LGARLASDLPGTGSKTCACGGSDETQGRFAPIACKQGSYAVRAEALIDIINTHGVISDPSELRAYPPISTRTAYVPGEQ